MKKRIAIIGGVVVAVGVIGGAGWYVWNQKADSGNEDSVYVTTVATLMGDISGTENRYAGVVEPQKTVKVKVESNRKVTNVQVKEGDTVHAGDVLFEYDASTSQDNLAQAELDLERYKNEANSLSNQIETLKKEKNEASADEQLSYTIEIQTAEMDLKKNEYNQKSKQAEIEKLKKALNDLEVTSDITGVVKSVNDSVISNSSDDFSDESSGGSNDSTTFITIVATGTYRVKGIVNETNRGSIMEGEPVIIRSRVDEEVTWAGTMAGVDTNEPEKESNTDSFYGSEGNEQTTSSNYPFYVDLESAEGLMLGQHVYIEMDHGQSEVKEGIWLDEFYIADADTEPYVWASTDKDRLEKRKVTLGEYDEELGKYQITEGLTKSDCIAFPDESYEAGMKTTINENAQTPTGEEGMDGEFDSDYDSSFDGGGDELMDSSFDSSLSPDEDGVEIIEEGVAPE